MANPEKSQTLKKGMGQVKKVSQTKKTKKNLSPHAARAETERRTVIIFGLLVNGFMRADIHRYVKTAEWGIRRAMIDRIIGEANKNIRLLATFEKDLEFGKTVARYNTLYMRAFNAGDYATAKNIQKELVDLFGLNELSAKDKLSETWFQTLERIFDTR